MEIIAGATYFYALAAVAMAFVGFTSVVLSIRQMLGAALSQFQLLLMLLLIEHGLVVVEFAFLPPLLAMFDIPHPLIWRISSATAAVFIAYWHVDYIWRRYPAARLKPHPIFAIINFAVTTLAVLGLFCNAIGYPLSSTSGCIRGLRVMGSFSRRRHFHPII